MKITDAQIQRVVELVGQMFPKYSEYKPDFSFAKKGKNLLDQEEYQRRVEEIIEEHSSPVRSFIEKSGYTDVLKTGFIGRLITKIYEIKEEGVILYHNLELVGNRDFYIAAVKLLGFSGRSKIQANMKRRLEKIAKEGDNLQ